MKRSVRCLLLVVAALASSGCEGGGAQSGPLPGSGGLGPVGNALGSGPSGATLIRVHMPWLLTTPSSSGGGTTGGGTTVAPLLPGANPTPFATPLLPRLGATPSNTAQAQSVTLNISGPTALTQTIALTSGAAGCVNLASGAVCQAALPLLPGTYSAVVGTYATTSAAPGSAIGAPQTIAFAVSYGASNVVNLALSGVPAQVDIVPGSPMSSENAQDGIDLYGAGKHLLVAQLLDANQNVLLGFGTPSINVVQIAGGLALSIVPPSPTSPNVFTASPPLTYTGGTATLRVSAGYPGQPANPCAQAGAACTGSVTVDVRQLLAVANASSNSVTLYAGGQNVPLVTIQSGVTNPQALVFDAAGDLFVASQPGSVTEYVAPYTAAPATIAIGVSHPQALALDARGNLFVANGSASNTVTEYAPPYAGAPIATISAGIDDPVSLGVDAAGNLFVANLAANTVTQYALPYGIAATTLSNGLNGPNSLAVDGRGDLFVSNLNSTPNSVVEFAPPFSSTSIPAATITSGVNEQGAIGLSPSASLFVPNQGANTVTAYGAPYAGAPTTISGGQSQPVALAIDAAANLYVANYGNNTVTVYPPPYAGASWITLSNGISNPQALALSPSTTSLVP